MIMATLTPEMKDFIANNLAWITTISKDGDLDIGPKMSMFVLDDNHLAYHERTAGQHYRNLEDGMKPYPAALLGAKQIGFTVLSISISLVAAFTPLIFMAPRIPASQCPS